MKRFFLVLFGVSMLLLSGCFGKSIEGQLEKEMKSPDAAVRLKAARQLGEVATAESLRILLLSKEDSDFRVKEEIQKSLKKIDKRTFLN
ncbi:MAG TPA: HEAT repeat domain-containing protein [Candidatus Rifleibacterium sp.]|nr:HEAT repeat domain-containing protein [Candidatus Rifleibacterium sp.]HPT46979.1 HEAT repeat domain-containing protein [Candidatus Rifleibacterium sp.]